jgi:cell division septation protein DedD
VQLGAVRSQADARAEWQRLQRRLGELVQGREPVFSSAQVSSGTMWRIRVGGFADAAAGRAFCEQVREKRGGCIVIPE